MAKNAPVPVQTCQFVKASDFFRGFMREFDLMADSDPDFTWGDNDRSMVAVATIRTAVDQAKDISKRFNQHCERVGLQRYVDLEN